MFQLQPRPSHQADTVWDCCEHGIETFLDRPRVARQVQNQAAPAQASCLSRKKSGGDLLYGYPAHLFSETGQHFFANFTSCVGSLVTKRRPCPAGRYDEAAPVAVRHLLQFLTDGSPVV